MKTPSWYRRARNSWIGIPYIAVAMFVTSDAAQGEPLWIRAAYACAALLMYFGAWKLADVAVGLRTRRV